MCAGNKSQTPGSSDPAMVLRSFTFVKLLMLLQFGKTQECIKLTSHLGLKVAVTLFMFVHLASLGALLHFSEDTPSLSTAGFR